MSTNTQTPASCVEVTVADLQGQGVIHCPNPKMPLWSAHPRIYLDMTATGEARCSYCGTAYRLKDGEKLARGH